jgi:hypothetical protein
VVRESGLVGLGVALEQHCWMACAVAGTTWWREAPQYPVPCCAVVPLRQQAWYVPRYGRPAGARLPVLMPYFPAPPPGVAQLLRYALLRRC